MRSEGLQRFVERKKSVERKRPQLEIEPRLITIDGVDGSGKSTIAQRVFEKLCGQFGKDRVVLVDITNLKGSPNQENLRQVVKENDIEDGRQNRIYAAGVNRAYGDIIVPALEQGKFVIVDRSEVDLLRYAIESEDKVMLADRKRYAQEGTLTHRLWAGHRVFIDADPKDIWRNLVERGGSSKYDPQSPEDVEKRIKAEEEAEQIVADMECSRRPNIIHKINKRADTSDERDRHINQIADQIIAETGLNRNSAGA